MDEKYHEQLAREFDASVRKVALRSALSECFSGLLSSDDVVARAREFADFLMNDAARDTTVGLKVSPWRGDVAEAIRTVDEAAAIAAGSGRKAGGEEKARCCCRK